MLWCEDFMTNNFFQTQKGVDDYIKMAAGFDGKEIIDILETYLPKGSTVLELGMGPGVDLDLLKKHYVVTGSDFSQIFLDLYTKKHPDADVLLLNAITLETEREFNAVYSNKVLIHLKDEELKKSIANQVKRLTANGIICHSFWAGSGQDEHNTVFFNYQSIDSLKRLFEPYFTILKLNTYTEMEKDDSILLIGKKKNKRSLL